MVRLASSGSAVRHTANSACLYDLTVGNLSQARKELHEWRDLESIVAADSVHVTRHLEGLHRVFCGATLIWNPIWTFMKWQAKLQRHGKAQ